MFVIAYLMYVESRLSTEQILNEELGVDFQPRLPGLTSITGAPSQFWWWRNYAELKEESFLTPEREDLGLLPLVVLAHFRPSLSFLSEPPVGSKAGAKPSSHEWDL